MVSQPGEGEPAALQTGEGHSQTPMSSAVTPMLEAVAWVAAAAPAAEADPGAASVWPAVGVASAAAANARNDGVAVAAALMRQPISAAPTRCTSI